MILGGLQEILNGMGGCAISGEYTTILLVLKETETMVLHIFKEVAYE